MKRSQAELFYTAINVKEHIHPGANMELLRLVLVLQPPLGPGFTRTEVLSVALIYF